MSTSLGAIVEKGCRSTEEIESGSNKTRAAQEWYIKERSRGVVVEDKVGNDALVGPTYLHLDDAGAYNHCHCHCHSISGSQDDADSTVS